MAETRAPLDAKEEGEEEVTGPAEPPFPVCLPPGLRPDWPAPRQAVLGERDGFAALLETWFAIGTVAGLSRLPHVLREPVIGALARLARAVDRRHSRSARIWLRQAFGPQMNDEELEARVLDSWRHLLRVTLDAEAFGRRVPPSSIRERCEIDLCPEARAILDMHAGCILVTGHTGDWEAGAAILPWLGFDPLYVVSKPPRNRPLSIRAQRIREERGVRLLPRRGAMQDAPAVIRAGGALVLMLDQRARTRPVLAPLFGRLAPCDRSAGVLLKRLGAPVLIGACYRTDRPWHWRVSMPRVLQPEEFRRHSVEAIVEIVNAELEKLILACPEQHFWLHDRYRGAPPVPDPGAAAGRTGASDRG